MDYFTRFTFGERVKITDGEHSGRTGDYLQTRYAILIDGCYGKQEIHVLPKHVSDDNPTPQPVVTPEVHAVDGALLPRLDRSLDIPDASKEVGDLKIKDGRHCGCKGASSCIGGRVKRRKRKRTSEGQ